MEIIKNKPNIVVFASDAKHLSYLNSIINEVNQGKFNIFAMICQDTRLKHPLYNKDRFQLLTNVNTKNVIRSHSLGVNLPFKPDWLIVSRERWDPEISIIQEFKNQFNAKIALVEPNSPMVSSINQFLEEHSRNRFVNDIDVFFDHSEFIKKQRKLLGFKGNIVVVGNPKHDVNLDINKEHINSLKEIYKIDPNKKQVLFFTLQNKYRYQLFEEFKKFKNKHPEYQYFVKPYPGEPFDPLFNKEYNPKFFIDGVVPILEESHIWGMYHICDVHVGSIGSVMYSSFLLNKEIYEFSNKIGARKNLDSNFDIINGSSGHEDKLEMWLNVFNMNLEDFKKLTSLKNIKPMLENNKEVWKRLDNFVHCNKDVLKMYDEFNDKKASKRIIDYIISYEK